MGWWISSERNNLDLLDQWKKKLKCSTNIKCIARFNMCSLIKVSVLLWSNVGRQEETEKEFCKWGGGGWSLLHQCCLFRFSDHLKECRAREGDGGAGGRCRRRMQLPPHTYRDSSSRPQTLIQALECARWQLDRGFKRRALEGPSQSIRIPAACLMQL